MTFFLQVCIRRLALCLVLGFASVAVSAQEFVGYEGKNAVREGDGGAKKTVEGVDFWSDGAPPRKFVLLGYVTDRRHKSGLIGMARMASLERDIAVIVKENGGDAAILVNSESETVGRIGNSFVQGNGSTASGFGASVGIQKHNSKFAVVRYVKETEAAVVKPSEIVVPPQATSVVSPSATAVPAAIPSSVAPTQPTPPAQ